MITEHDNRSQRCKRLGHPVRFEYCRTQSHNSLCPCILDCWWERFDVEAFLRAHGQGDAVDNLRAAPPRPKVASLVELIEQAKRRNGRDGGREH